MICFIMYDNRDHGVLINKFYVMRRLRCPILFSCDEERMVIVFRLQRGLAGE